MTLRVFLLEKFLGYTLKKTLFIGFLSVPLFGVEVRVALCAASFIL